MNNFNPEANRMLALRNPHLLKEWHKEKNGKWTPFNTTYCSNRKIWWRCEFGHEWISTANNRHNGNGCPYCSGTLTLPEKSFAVRFPHLLKEWHPTENKDHDPETIGPHSIRKFWWVCKAGHEWKATVGNRTRGTTCPHCTGKAFTTERCLAIRHPEMVIEWHPVLNGDLTPFDVTYGLDRNVWWQCAKGHEWQAIVKDRTQKGVGCPYCSGKRASQEDNFAIRFPALVREWHPTKNGDNLPQHFRPYSAKKVWWQCSKVKSHEWQASPCDRTRTGHCPFCSGRRVGEDNNLSILHPELSREWHPTKNAEMKPDMFRPGSNKKVWWLCDNGHEWQAVIRSRVRGNGCLVCNRARRVRRS